MIRTVNSTENYHHLLVAGGFGPDSFYSGVGTVEVIDLSDPTKDCTLTLPDLPHAVTGAFATNLGGEPTVCGGMDGLTQLNVCQVLAVKENATGFEWTVVTEGMGTFDAPRVHAPSWR